MTDITKNNSIISSNSEQKNYIKSISLIQIPSKTLKKRIINKKIKSLLGQKRKTFKKIPKKQKIFNNKLSVNKQAQFSIKKTSNDKSNNNKEPCIICFEKISFQDKHYLHCGHCYHCDCINKWIDLGNYECPICKQEVDCDKILDDTISLEEDEYDYPLIVNDFNQNNINDRNMIIRNSSNNKGLTFLIIIYLLFWLFYLLTGLINKNIFFEIQ